jgi:hypothetical protein
VQYYSLIAGLRTLRFDDKSPSNAREIIAENLTKNDAKIAAFLDEWDEIAAIENLEEKKDLFIEYYNSINKSNNKFLKEYSLFDKNLRENLPKIDTQNLVEFERKLDELRWQKTDELSADDYFGFASVLAYLVRLKIVERWAKLDPETGRKMYQKILTEIK